MVYAITHTILPMSALTADIKVDVDNLQELVGQSRRAIIRVDALITALHSRYGPSAGSVHFRNIQKDAGCSSNSRNPHWVVLVPLGKIP